jgi:hypothetical protein
MHLKAAITGNLRAALQAEVRQVAGAMRRAVTTAGQQAQSELRAQARGAGFKDGGRSMANAWRLQIFPPQGRAPDTLRPAALVYSRMPTVAEAFDKGAIVTPRRSRYLAWPTGYNAALGRRQAGRRGGLRVTPAQMIQAGKRGEAFVLETKNPGVKLWCLRITQENRNKKRLRLFVGRGVEVVTGKVKGLQQTRRDVLKKGFVPMFFLSKQVALRKRLNIAAVRSRAGAMYARAATAELSRLRAA